MHYQIIFVSLGIKLRSNMKKLLFISLILFSNCSTDPESSLTLSSLAHYQSNDCSGNAIEVGCIDENGNILVNLTTQISCVAGEFSWMNYYQEWVNSIEDTGSFSSSVDPNNNTCTISYDTIELTGVWAGESNSCQIPNATIASGNCVEFIFTE